MNQTNLPTDSGSAEFIPFAEFRDGLALGKFRVIVNPDLARRFVADRALVVPLVIAIIGCGVASAVAGHTLVGISLVAAGVLFRRAVSWQAPNILLYLASHQPAAYHDATANGVMEVRRA